MEYVFCYSKLGKPVGNKVLDIICSKSKRFISESGTLQTYEVIDPYMNEHENFGESDKSLKKFLSSSKAHCLIVWNSYSGDHFKSVRNDVFKGREEILYSMMARTKYNNLFPLKRFFGNLEYIQYSKNALDEDTETLLYDFLLTRSKQQKKMFSEGDHDFLVLEADKEAKTIDRIYFGSNTTKTQVTSDEKFVTVECLVSNGEKPKSFGGKVLAFDVNEIDLDSPFILTSIGISEGSVTRFTGKEKEDFKFVKKVEPGAIIIPDPANTSSINDFGGEDDYEYPGYGPHGWESDSAIGFRSNHSSRSHAPSIYSGRGSSLPQPKDTKLQRSVKKIVFTIGGDESNEHDRDGREISEREGGDGDEKREEGNDPVPQVQETSGKESVRVQ